MATSKSSGRKAFPVFGKEKSHQGAAWAQTVARQNIGLTRAQAEKKLADARAKIKDKPAGSAVKLGVGVFLKKYPNGKCYITSMQ